MKIKMKPIDRQFIDEYNYPAHHKEALMYGTHDVIDKQGCCYKIKVDGDTYYMSIYDMMTVDELPEDLFEL